ncbi:MAG TPA: hypothetical protein VLA12_03850, partial [Planctomycetaceae bacterium]|nr:hypothetical protein [Planctomycetaceae bacterium]
MKQTGTFIGKITLAAAGQISYNLRPALESVFILPVRSVMMRAVRFWLVWLLLASSSGCSYFQNLNNPNRFQNGYTLVLPGIETASFANSNIAQGLENGGVTSAI